MKGRFSLTNSNVNDKVEKGRTGVYKLYNSSSGSARYVGMSTELADRLKDYTEKYRFFEFEYHSSERDAYKREANIFHQHGGADKLDNEKHPPRPHRRVKCPACSIHD